MRLTRLYSNRPSVFPAIVFNRGLNVIFAKVEAPLLKDKSSHNLGKTFLVSVIDFALLAGIKKPHPFVTHKDRFSDFVFCIEFETTDGQFVTVRRPVDGARNSLFVNIAQETRENLFNLPDKEWTHPRLSQRKAKELVDKTLKLELLRRQDITFRKVMSYFLRRQSDYTDVFRLSKYLRSKDIDWKPVVAHLLGFNTEQIRRKYRVEAEISNLSKTIQVLQDDSGEKGQEYGEVSSMIESAEEQVNFLRSELEKFSFNQLESEMTSELVEKIEVSVGILNQTRYTLMYELTEIRKSLTPNVDIDLNSVTQIYKEMEKALPELLVRSYEELIDFRHRITQGRAERLRETERKFVNRVAAIDDELSRLDGRRSEVLSVLQERKTMRKFKELQRELLKREEQLTTLRGRLKRLDSAEVHKEQIKELERQVEEAVRSLRSEVREQPARFISIKKRFRDFFRQIMGANAILFADLNTNDNIEFYAKTLSASDSNVQTSESEGTSYRKMLCACYDLTLLVEYAEENFFRFVYHDGVFEGLDNRKKIALLDLVRNLCDSKGLQYILTVIDSDLPRSDTDNKVLFSDSEIVRKLHDRGNDGRLFQMPVF